MQLKAPKLSPTVEDEKIESEKKTQDNWQVTNEEVPVKPATGQNEEPSTDEKFEIKKPAFAQRKNSLI